jgi:hypothetical protein
MNGAVISNKHIQRRHHPNKSRESHRIPPAQILIVQQRCSRGSSRAHHPERDDNGKYTAYVEAKEDALDQWEFNGQKSVEEDGVEDDRDRDQGAVPSLGNIRLVVERDQALDDAADHEADTGEIYLPSDRGKPACDFPLAADVNFGLDRDIRYQRNSSTASGFGVERTQTPNGIALQQLGTWNAVSWAQARERCSGNALTWTLVLRSRPETLSAGFGFQLAFWQCTHINEQHAANVHYEAPELVIVSL